ncbi:MAG: CARDB domain-containing protein [Bacteroidales bacterium]
METKSIDYNFDNKIEINIFHKFFTMKRSVLLAIFSLMLLQPIFAQTAMIKADSIVANQGDSIEVAIRVQNLPQIGSLTLYIQYNASVLNFGRALNMNPLLLGGNPLINRSGNTIVLSWADINGATLGTDKLLDLKFKYNGGISSISFTTGCEATDILGNVISPSVVYRGGSVTESLSLNITSVNNALCLGDSMLLTAHALNGYGNYTYSWSSDPAGLSSTMASIWVKPLVNTTYSVSISDGVDIVNGSKLITIFTDPQPSSASNMLPANNSLNLTAPIQISWAPGSYASTYDIYLWSADSVNRPPTPIVSNTSQINYTLNSGLNWGKSYKWQIVSKNLCHITNGPIQQFSIRALPELHVTQITTSQAYSGQPLTISWTVKNDGLGSTGVDSWFDHIWISPDIEIRVGEDIGLGQFQNVSYLGPGQSYTNNVQVIIPNNMMGTYYIFVVTDANDACLIDWSLTGNGPSNAPVPYTPNISGIPYPYIRAYAHNIGNILEPTDNPPYHDNFFYKQLDIIMPPVPDLIVNQIVPPTNVFSGQQIYLPFSVKNQGYATATGNWSDVVYISADTVFNPSSAILLGSYPRSTPLQPDSIYYKNVQLTIPPNILGTYYLFIKTDATNQVFESVYEPNNLTKSAPFQIFLTPPPDLIVNSIQVPDSLTNKDIVPIHFTVKNQGATPTSNGHWVDKVYLTDASNNDLSSAFLVGSYSRQGNLDADSSYIAATNITIPPGISGTYYIYVKTDANLEVFEYTNDNNNVSRQTTPSIIITPDLIVTNVESPLTENNNLPITISWTVKNNGLGKLVTTEVTDKIFISKTNVFHPDSVLSAATLVYNLSLLAGDSVLKQKQLLLPQNISGNYYVFVYTDYTNTVYEVPSETNNVKNNTNPIQIHKPDLIVSDLTYPTSFNSGQTAFLEWKVKNIGLGQIANKKWTDKIYLSKASAFYADSVIEIGALTYIQDNLNTNDSIQKSLNINIPNILSGNYFVYIYTDAKDTVYEGSNENNNTLRSQTAVPVLNPNLIVTKVSYIAAINSGQAMNVEWTTQNIGLGKLYYSGVSDKIYLSSSPNFQLDSVVMLGIKNYNVTLLTNDSINNQATVNIPNGISGYFYIFIHTNYNSAVYEGGMNTDNKTKGPSIHISLAPWADLQLKNIIIADSLTPGENFTVNFSVKNSGNTSINGISWLDKLYISSSSDFDTTAISLASFIHLMQLDTGITYQNSFSSVLSSSFTSGYYFFYAVTDENNTVFEYLYENNNILRSNPVYIKPYPVNLALTSFTAPDSSFTGQNINIQWTTINNSNKPTLPSYWYDALYLSVDTIWNPGSDLLLKEWKQNGPQLAGDSYSNSLNVLIPNGLNGYYYLIMITDHTNINNELVTSDNRKLKSRNNHAATIKIKLTPSPDLVVKTFTTPQQCISGQPFKVVFKVKNQGVGPTTIGSWTDKVYLSNDFTISQGDVNIGTYNYTGGILDTGQYYQDSIYVTIPVGNAGNYILIFKTDHSDMVFEFNAESNNTANAFVIAIQPPPADIVVKTITMPDSAMVGMASTISWVIENIGPNPATGNMKDMVYLSLDTVWDMGDKLIGEYQSYINLPTLGTQSRSISNKIPGVAIGNYYVIVRSDILNNIYESNDTNNTSYSLATSYINMQRLHFNIAKNDTLYNNTDLYYLLDVPDSLKGESMLTTLKADSLNGSNEMYLKFNQLSTRLNYEYSHSFPYQGNQELLVPYLFKGNYYMLLYGRTLVSPQQKIKITPEILNFEVRSINSNKGGNSGKITVALLGSKFNAFMKIRLQRGNDTIHAESLQLVNITKAFVKFNLINAVPGFYNVIVEHLCEGTIVIPNGFEVKNGTPNYLSVNAIAPNNVRAGRVISYTVEYANLGNTDIIAPSIDIKSYAGAPISVDAAGLSNNATTLHIPLQILGEPNNILRPGITGSIVIYSRALTGLGFTISVSN